MIQKNKLFNSSRLLLLLGLFALAGCVRNDVDETVKGDGTPTECFIRMIDSGLTSTPVTRGMELDPDEERRIESLFIFVFDESGTLLSSTEHINVFAHGAGETWDPIQIHAITGNNRQIYAVANYNAQVIENIKSTSSLEDLKNLVVQNLGNPLSQEQGLIKVGFLENVNIRSGQTYSIDMVNLVSKITVNVVNKCADLDITGWTIDGFAMKSYVVERPFDPDNLNYNDAPNINDRDDFYNSFADQSFDFPTVDDKTAGVKNYSVTGYCYENRRGGRIERDEPPVGWPNGDENSGVRKDYQLKSWYAPENATRVRVYGRVRTENKMLAISHYLGENNTDNYNVFRGKHYIYTITINGLTSIDIDTNIDQASDRLIVNESPDLMFMDAHHAPRMFQILTNELQPDAGTVDFEVLSNLSSETERPDWVKVSEFSLLYHQVKAAAADETNGSISTWQQDDVPEHYYARTKYIPHKSVRDKLGSYTPPAGVTLGSDAYPEEDDELPYGKATHRMCYKITGLPIPDSYNPTVNKPITMFIYADEFEYDPSPTAADYREAVVRVTFTPKGGAPQYSYFTLRQYRPVMFRGLPGETTAIVMERNEEFNTLLQTSLPLDRQTLAGLQWGPAVAGEADLATSLGDGLLNTVRAIYKDVPDAVSWSAEYANERTKYGSNTGAWRGMNGLISQPAPGTLSGQPDFLYSFDDANYPDKQYNVTAARACFEKNADRNGDGVISADEVMWYLPSQQELQMMWTYNEVLNLAPVFYWSSTLPAAGSANAVAISMRRSPSDVGVNYNGVPQERLRTGYLSTTPPRVRCVRRVSTTGATGSQITPLSPIVMQTVDGSAVIDCSSLPGSLYTATSKFGISQKSISELQNSNTKIYKKFEVQSTQDAAGATYLQLYHGLGRCNESEGWRMPTQRELLLIWSVRDKLEAIKNFEPFLDEPYWTMLRSNTQNYLVDFSTGLAMCHEPQDHPHKYRCIREL